MKNHLLLGSVLLTTISAFSQVNTGGKHATPVNMADRIARKFENLTEQHSTSAVSAGNNATNPVMPPVEENSTERTANTSAVYTTWSKFTGSMNIYGMTISEARPLQYDDELNAVTFVHRKSNSYLASPAPATTGAQTGVLVAMVSSNLGQTWDSTCVWNDNNNWARYPQGGILNPAGNTNIANAHIIATAPITQANSALGWIGSGFSAKSLGPGTYNNVAGSQTFAANSAPFTGLGVKVDFPTYGFSSTDDGKVRVLGQVFNNNINTPATADYAGARILKGEFISGNVAWTETMISPPVRSGATGSLVSSTAGMAWSEDGQTGYVYNFGSTSAVPQYSSGTNSGFQPIIHKTTDGGTTWQLVSGMDFTTPTFSAAVLDHLPSTRSNTNLTIPFFNTDEGISGVVDRNNKLHLVGLVMASFSGDPDSSAFFTSFGNYDGESYNYLHTAGARPYLYDFTGDGSPTGWEVTVIDSLPTEGPGTRVADAGYSFNPWDQGGSTGTDKIVVESRIQASRTPDGANIIYTWAESDTNLTVGSLGFIKWNRFPSVKARLMQVSPAGNLLLSPTEINVTKLTGPNGNFNTGVNNRGYCHVVAPKCAVNATATSTGILAIHLPITVSNSPIQLEQANPINHWYSTAGLQFTVAIGVGIPQNNISVSSSALYPNPASNSTTLSIDLKSNSKVNIAIMNMVGQTVKTSVAEGQAGANSINVDLSSLSKGVYLVNVKVDNTSSTKKLVIE